MMECLEYEVSKLRAEWKDFFLSYRLRQAAEASNDFRELREPMCKRFPEPDKIEGENCVATIVERFFDRAHLWRASTRRTSLRTGAAWNGRSFPATAYERATLLIGRATCACSSLQSLISWRQWNRTHLTSQIAPSPG